jgi:hypothetical protein
MRRTFGMKSYREADIAEHGRDSSVAGKQQALEEAVAHHKLKLP